MRIDELERRLARLERQMIEASPQAAPEAPEAEPGQEGPDEGIEGARLVAIQLLTSGYGREEVIAYLRHTFGIVDPEAVLADAGLAPG